MKRAYNRGISQRANGSLRKRARILQLQRQMLALAAAVICLMVLLGGGIRALARGRGEELHKYYTSICLDRGDTLWELADEYTVEGLMDRDAFIREVSELNRLSDGQIHSGAYIIVPYYSSAVK